MRRPIRLLVLVASLLLVAGTTAACGDDSGSNDASDAPQSASTDDFCDAYNGLFDKLMSSDSPSDDEAVKAFKDWASEMTNVGTPEDMPDDARRGFEVAISTISDIDDDASQKDLENLDDQLSDDEKKDSQAFGAWATETCPSDVPSDLPSSELQAPDPSTSSSTDTP